MINVFCFGDSLTFGENDLQSGGWVERLRLASLKQYATADYLALRIYNLGIGGETTDGLLRRFEFEVAGRALGKQRNVFIFQYGLNDLIIHKEKNRVPPDYFVRNLRLCLKAIDLKKDSVTIIGVPAITQKLDNVRDQHGNIRRLEDIKQYNQLLRAISSEFKAQFIPVDSQVMEEAEPRLSDDGVHFNAVGHEYLAGLLGKSIKLKSQV